MRTLGFVVLFVVAMLVGAVSIYHLWEWLSLLSEGRSTLDDLAPAVGWLGLLGLMAVGAFRAVNRMESSEHGA